MNLRQLAEELEIPQRAPVFFDSTLSKQKGLIMQFCNHPEVGIHIPVWDLSEYCMKAYAWNPFTQNYIDKMIKKHIHFENLISFPVMCAFSLFHEEGHWVHLKESGLSGEDFMRKDFKYRKPVEDLGEQLKNMDRYAEETEVLGKKHAKMYRNIPIEKYADKYALSKLEHNLPLIRDLGFRHLNS